MRGGGRQDRALDHAAQHDLQPERAGGVDHRQRTANTAALDEFHVDAVDAAGEREQVAGILRVFIGHERNRCTFANPAQPLGRTGRNRLFAKFDLEALEFAQQRHRRLGIPRFVGVDADRAAVD